MVDPSARLEGLLLSLEYWAMHPGHKRFRGDPGQFTIPTIRKWWKMRIEECEVPSDQATKKLIFEVWTWCRQTSIHNAAWTPGGARFTLAEFKDHVRKSVRDIMRENPNHSRIYSRGGKRILRPRPAYREKQNNI